MVLSMRQRRRAARSTVRARQDGLTVVFEASGFDDPDAQIADVALQPGQPFIIDLTLRLPVAAAFDLAGAESIFRSAMPAGLKLMDVHSNGQNIVVIETVVVDVPEESASATASMSIWPLLLRIGAWILVRWKLLSLIGIGLFFGLGFLVSGITGRTLLPGVGGALKSGFNLVLIVGLVFAGTALLNATRRST